MVDATRLERNLNLALQVLEITDRVVVCLNLMDEARQHGIQIDVDGLAGGERVESGVAIVDVGHDAALLFEGFAQNETDRGFVVGDEDLERFVFHFCPYNLKELWFANKA